MKILQYTEKHKQFRQRMRAFMENNIIPNVDQWEKDRIVPKSSWKLMGEQGFICTSVAPEYGGLGLDFLYGIILTEELAKTNHTGSGQPIHSEIMVPYISKFATGEAKKKYLPGCVSGDIITALAMTEPDAGSDVAAIATTALEDGKDVIINGSKIFISNGINCDVAIVATKDPSIKNPYKALTLYLVEAGTPGFEKGKKLEKMGMYSQDTAELFFVDCRVPRQNRLGEKGRGFYVLMDRLAQERIILTLQAQVAAEYALEQTVNFYNHNAGAGKLLPKSQANQFALVEMATEIKLGRTFIDKLIADQMDGKDIVTEVSMAKFWITEMSRRVINQGLDIFGDLAMSENCPIVRTLRDVRILSIAGGTNEIMRNIISKNMGL